MKKRIIRKQETQEFNIPTGENKENGAQKTQNKVKFPELNKDQDFKWKGPAYNNYNA